MEHYETLEAALSITIPASDDIYVEETRRLTGPSLWWDKAGAILQAVCPAVETDGLIDELKTQVEGLANALSWFDTEMTYRPFEGGFNFAISAPNDQLYTAVFLLETAAHFAFSMVLGEDTDDYDEMLFGLRDVSERETNPQLLELQSKASSRGVDALQDDDEISFGHGKFSRTYSVFDLPDEDDIPWDKLSNIPLALVTGTNGKTTTTRLLAAMGREAGQVSGLTSTDFVKVGDEILDRGDYSGPGGARLLLRDKHLERGYLEVARGGILRRGLATRAAKVAIVTNVASDHLGQYGVNTVEELAKAKFAVYRALLPEGRLVVNADEDYVRREAAVTPAPLAWFALSKMNEKIEASIHSNTSCAYLNEGVLVLFDGETTHNIINVSDVPITLGGAARYNVSNALAAILASYCLEIPFDAMRRALETFRNSSDANPGRLNEFAVKGARAFVDFAHNPHSIAAVVETVLAMPAKRRFVMLSHAGDRSDRDIRDVTNSVLALAPDILVATDLRDYLRGREDWEVPDLIEKTALESGFSKAAIWRAESPLNAVQQITAALEEGDIALLLTLSDRDEIFEHLTAFRGET